VLVLDDDQTIAELMRIVLEEAGFDVTVCVETALVPRGRFDCLVTALMSVSVYSIDESRDWLLSLADRFPGVPVIVVTAHPEARDDQSALGAHEVIIKPFDVEHIADSVGRAITS